MSDLIAAGERLADVLERENTALAALAFSDITPLVAEKTAAVEDLARAYGAAGGAEAAGSREELGALHRRLNRLMDENRRLLMRGIAAQSGLVEVIARLLSGGEAAAGYGTTGKPGRSQPIAVSARA